MIQNEVAILRRVKHQNIVLLIEEVDTYNELYLVMELVKVSFCNAFTRLYVRHEFGWGHFPKLICRINTFSYIRW